MNELAVVISNDNENVTPMQTIDAVKNAGFKHVFLQWYNKEWKCWYYTDYRRGHGYLNVTQALQHSCNYFFYETGDRMGIDTLSKYALH